MVEIRQMLQDGRYNDAAAACREALSEAPDHPDLRMLMGLCEEAAGRPDSARAWMEKALDKAPAHPAAGFHFGRLLLLDGRDDEAREALEPCVAADPNHAAARTLLARIEQRAGRSDAAVEGLRTALLANEDYAPAHAGLATLLLRRGELEEAHKHAAAAVRLRPEDMLSQVTMAQVFQAQGHADFAEQCLRNALQRQPDHPQLRAALEQLSRVRAAGAAGEETDNPAAQFARMREHYRSGRLAPAAELALALQHRFGRDRAELLELAEVLMDAGQLDTAGEILKRADPGLARLPLTRARLSAVRGDVAAALDQLGALYDSESPGLRHDARRLAADLHLREARMEAALEVLAPLLEQPDLAPATVRMVAQLEHVSGDTAAARGLLEQLLERQGLHEAEQAVTHNLLGRVLDESGAFEAAGRHLGRGGWRQPFLVDELAQFSPDSLRQAWSGLTDWPHADTAVDDDRRAPLFVAGWPGTGREALLPALMGAGRFSLLPGNELMRRRELLRLPAGPEDLARLSEADLRLARKRYLRGVAQAPDGALEPGLFEATALPALARFFPGARLIWLQAPEEALRLHWRLAGCRDIERMVQVWQAEQALFERLAPLLPLELSVLELEPLLADPARALQALGQALGLDDSAGFGPAMARALHQAGYREAGHWRHYKGLL